LLKNYKSALSLLGEDPSREGLQKTPERLAKAMQFLNTGLPAGCACYFVFSKFHEEVSEMIIVKDIELYSMCEHHMLPFYGKAHVAYIPNGGLQA
jgi:GTP cyclohydrolase I